MCMRASSTTKPDVCLYYSAICLGLGFEVCPAALELRPKPPGFVLEGRNFQWETGDCHFLALLRRQCSSPVSLETDILSSEHALRSRWPNMVRCRGSSKHHLALVLAICPCPFLCFLVFRSLTPFCFRFPGFFLISVSRASSQQTDYSSLMPARQTKRGAGAWPLPCL
jgi:hypothetical protein